VSLYAERHSDAVDRVPILVLMAEPKRLIEPGDYRCRWKVGGHEIAGAIEIQPNRRPVLAFDQSFPAGEGSVPSGEIEHVSRVAGRLLTNQDVVALDVDIQKVFPGRDFGSGRFAIVGIDVADVPDDRYAKATVQVTGADMLIGALPFASVRYPGSPGNPLKEYSVTLREETNWRWRAESEGIEITCRYVPVATIHRYGFEVAMMPLVELQSVEPLTLPEWIDRWIVPLVETTTFTTRRMQHVAALSVSTGGERATIGAVFGPGIAQAPYYSSDGREWMTGPKSLF